jgi:hypothetical protein
MYSASDSCWVIAEMKVEPLSDCRVEGSWNQGMIWVRRALVTSLAFSVEVENASVHHVKVSPRVRRYFHP